MFLENNHRVGYIIARSAPLPHIEGLTMDLVLLNIKNNTFPLIHTIILPKIVNPAQPETLVVIY